MLASGTSGSSSPPRGASATRACSRAEAAGPAAREVTPGEAGAFGAAPSSGASGCKTNNGATAAAASRDSSSTTLCSGDRTLSEADLEQINTWMAERTKLIAHRDLDDIHRAVDYLNTTTHWVQSKANDKQLDDITDDLLLAMHDLRSVLVRKKADRMMKGR